MKCLFHPGASVYHKVSPERMTIGYFRQRGFNQGISDSYTQLRGEVVASACKHSLSFSCRALGLEKPSSFMVQPILSQR